MKDKLLALISKSLNLPIEQIKMESDIAKDLHADSLDVLDIAMSIEEEMNVTIEDDDYAKLTTVNDIYELISKKSAGDNINKK